MGFSVQMGDDACIFCSVLLWLSICRGSLWGAILGPCRVSGEPSNLDMLFLFLFFGRADSSGNASVLEQCSQHQFNKFARFVRFLFSR